MVKLKQEKEMSTDETSDEELSPLHSSFGALSQIMPGQQFFQDMNNELANMPRTEYVKRLLGVCNIDSKRISLYREHLWDKARVVSGCPQGRLIARKGSVKCSKSEKLANDCYVLHQFLQGERSGETYDLISANSILNDSVQINLGTQDDDQTLLKEPFKEPDVTAILLSLQTDVAELKSQRAEDVKTITGLKEKIESATQLQTCILTSVNGLRASLPPSDLCSKIDKILTLLTENSETNVHTDCVVVNVPMEMYTATKCSERKLPVEVPTVHAPDTVITVDDIYIVDNTDTTTVGASEETPAQYVTMPESQSDVSSTGNRTYANVAKTTPKLPAQTNTLRPRDRADRGAISNVNGVDETKRMDARAPEFSHDHFTAVRHRRKTQYYLGNIDTDVSYGDIQSFLDRKRLSHVTFRIFYGRSSASIRLNIPCQYESMVESDNFWPDDMLFRRWKTRADWDTERKSKARSRYTPKTQNTQYRVRDYSDNFRGTSRYDDHEDVSYRDTRDDNTRYYDRDDDDRQNEYNVQYNHNDYAWGRHDDESCNETWN